MHTFSAVFEMVGGVCASQWLFRAHSEASFSCMKLPSAISTSLSHVTRKLISAILKGLKTPPSPLGQTDENRGVIPSNHLPLNLLLSLFFSLWHFRNCLLFHLPPPYGALSSTNTQKPKCMTHTHRRARAAYTWLVNSGLFETSIFFPTHACQSQHPDS